MPRNMQWQSDARCSQADAHAFYPEQGASAVEAKMICRACTVRDQCLDYAMAHNERHGVWGGMTDPERQRLKRDQSTA